VSENRFLQSFSALLASAILVCGTHLLLIASQPAFEPQPAEVELPVSAPSLAPASENSVEITTESASEAPLDRQAAPETTAPEPVRAPSSREITASLPQSLPTPTAPFVGDQTSLGADDAAPTGPATSEAAPDTASAETTSAEPQLPANASVPEQHAVAEIAEEQQHAVSPPVEEQHASTTPSDIASHAPAAQQASVETVAAPTSEPITRAGADDNASAAIVAAAEVAASPSPAGADDNASAAIVAAAEVAASPSPMDEAKSPALTASVDSAMPQAIASAAAVAAAQPAPNLTAAVASQSPQSESVPLPTPKPTPVADGKTAKPAPKPQAPAAEPEDQAATEQKPRWAAMALAPADKDTVAKPKLSPKRTESAGGYNSKIWSALARHKPKTGKSGSASVTFAIGPGGGLKSVRVSGSSGDSQLDQMALATVRNAAPFPPPPNPASASYTIRIYFR